MRTGNEGEPFEFSIAYLLLETFWIAAALSLTTQLGSGFQHELAAAAFWVAWFTCWGAALGGLMKGMRPMGRGGFCLGLCIAVLLVFRFFRHV